MRLFPFALLLLFAPMALAQDAPPPPPEPVEPKEAPVVEEKKVDEWAVEKPESAPEGEAVALKISMDPAIEHHMVIVTDLTQTVKAMGQKVTVNNKMAAQLKLASGEEGGASFAMPVDLQSITVGGNDQTAQAQQQLSNPSFTGKLDGNGDVVAGSVKSTGMPPGIEHLLKASVNSILSFAGSRSVRKGEVWEVDAAKFAQRVSSFEGGAVTGNVYMKLAGAKDVGGAQCADIAGVFAIAVKGAMVNAGMGKMPADLRIKGDCKETCGLDGVVRSRVVNVKIEVMVQGTAVDVVATTKTDGGPKEATKPAETEKPGGGEAGHDEKHEHDHEHGKEHEHEIEEEGCGN